MQEPAGRIEQHERETLEYAAKDLILNSPRLEAIALCVDILKINSDEARLLALMEDDADLIEVGKQLHSMYRVRIIAITNGPDQAYLFEAASSSHQIQQQQQLTLGVAVYSLPPLLETFLDMAEDVDMDSTASSPKSNALPESTGQPSPMLQAINPLRASSRHGQPSNNSSSASLCSSLSLRERAEKDCVINPLGAGDTCSAIFLLEYLETQNAVVSFQHGLAAASASCLVVDSTSHFDIKIKNALFDRITVEQFDVVVGTVTVE
eukprot:jgi/Hompol1/5040/HPOL_000731-RA